MCQNCKKQSKDEIISKDEGLNYIHLKTRCSNCFAITTTYYSVVVVYQQTEPSKSRVANLDVPEDDPKDISGP